MKKIQILKKSFYLLLTVVTFLPAINLSARGGEEGRGGGERNMGSERNMGAQRQSSEHKYQSPGDKGFESHRYNENRYNENAGYGSGAVVVPTTPAPDSQPGMSDDSDALYNSYMQK